MEKFKDGREIRPMVESLMAWIASIPPLMAVVEAFLWIWQGIATLFQVAGWLLAVAAAGLVLMAALAALRWLRHRAAPPDR